MANTNLHLKIIQHDASSRHVNEFFLNINSYDSTAFFSLRYDDGNHAAAGTEINRSLPLPYRGKIAEQKRVQGEAVAFNGLNNAQAIAA